MHILFLTPEWWNVKKKSFWNRYEITVDRLPKFTQDKFLGSCDAIGLTNPVKLYSQGQKQITIQTHIMTFVKYNEILTVNDWKIIQKGLNLSSHLTLQVHSLH